MAARGTSLAGTVIAGYAVGGLLGRGGMACVHRASHPDRDEPVALKVIDPTVWDDEARAQFHREARLAAAVAHRHILPVYEAGEAPGCAFVAMRLEPGDLGGLLRQEGRLSPARAVRLVSQVASALDAAHAHGLVHRDVKPSNVLLGEEDGAECVYVADFGVARASFTGDGAVAGELVGTVSYASPEQIRGEPVDHRTDVYALGCLLHECLTGRVPFVRRSGLATMWAHLHDEPPAPSMLVPGVPPGLDEVVARALAKDPRSRFGSAGALAQAAREAVEGAQPERAQAAARILPTGTVTFLFTDVEGSTRLLHELGAEGYAAELVEHRRVIREACAAEGGVEVDTQGDAFFFAFADAESALSAAAALRDGLGGGPIRVRVGVHTGTPHVTSEGYVGVDVHRAARIAACGHGGQVVVSQATASHFGSRVDQSQALPLVPLGAHRLKDFDEPVTLYQLGEGSFPPLKTIANSNLPTPVSSFLGREQELFEADRLLQGTRLLTLTGPGGAGKTRFGLELARRAREDRFADYPDGVFGCFLAPLRDPALVLPTIAQTLGVPEQPGTSALESLGSHVEGKRMLLLLDNLEHLLPAAPELAELLERCPGLTLLCTSRERQRLRGETAWELPPLQEDEGLALFCERARIEPSQPIRELCSRLEGLPLAIELAAARMSLLSPEQLLARLAGRLDLLKGSRDADPRQQTLRATIEWSYELLSPEEQRLFRALSVFRGGCTLEAAEEVADADLDELESLLDKSLLRRMDADQGPRFWMLETIREYAAQRLEESGEGDELRRLHAEFFLALAEEVEPPLLLMGDGEWVAVLAAETDNIRAAADVLGALDDPARELRFLGALFRFWLVAGLVREGLDRVERALRRADAGRYPELRLKLLYAATICAGGFGDLETCRRSEEERLELARRLGDERAEAIALNDLGCSARDAGDLGTALSLFEKCETLADRTGDRETLAVASCNLAELALIAGDPARARDLSGRAMTDPAVAGDPWISVPTCAHASALLALGETDRAAELFAGILAPTMRTLGPIYAVAVLEGLAATQVGRLDATAARLFGAADAARRRGGFGMESTGSHAASRPARDVCRAALGQRAWADAYAAGEAVSLDEAVAYILELLGDD